MRSLAAVAADDGFRAGLVLTAFAFGLRHGVDWDHIAAITDITNSQDNPRRSISLATTYAAGHAVVVFALGVVAVLVGDLVPAGVDAAMGRLVGVTLVALGVYVLYALVRHGRDFRMRSRWMLLFSGAARGVRWARRRGRRPTEEIVHEHDHEHDAVHGHDGVGGDDGLVPSADGGRGGVVTAVRTHRHRHAHHGTLPDDPFANYGRWSAMGVGMIHGVGAETPTQVLLFLAAAKAGGTGAGLLLLGVFVLGLLVSNSVIAVVSTFGFLNATRSFTTYAAVAVVTGVVSTAVGVLFLLGRESALPAFFGG